jgi:hypothetical protein
MARYATTVNLTVHEREAVVEQRDVEIFLTLAEELHFGRTAERLHVSTARVSQSIAKWERRVGVPLFERTSPRPRGQPAHPGKSAAPRHARQHQRQRHPVPGPGAGTPPRLTPRQEKAMTPPVAH